MTGPAHRAILEAARHRFSTDGYQAVTIRAIAADAGYSPALVMKLMGSKERLFWLVAPDVTSPSGLENERELIPREQIGRELVRRIFHRKRSGAGDPYATAPLLAQGSPDPSQIHSEIWDRYTHNVAAMIGDATQDRRHARAVVAVMFGIAAAVHTMNGYTPDEDEMAIEAYARLVQIEINLCDGPRIPLPDESVGIAAVGHTEPNRED